MSGGEEGICAYYAQIRISLKLGVDGELYLSIIRPTSGAVETENSLINNELCRFRQSVASAHRSPQEVEKQVLTAACNAVEIASR